MRNQAVDMKFGAIVSNVRDKRIVLIDDSIVRGTTMQPIVGLLRRSGAKEVFIIFVLYSVATKYGVAIEFSPYFILRNMK
jgi:glutamine phosphoribosylpyrophosphate amidotransferase